MLEQVARDVTGWPTRAVEYHPLLVATRPRQPRAPRPGGRGRAARRRDSSSWPRSSARRPPAAPSTRCQHTAEVRRIASRGAGATGSATSRIFPFPVQTYRSAPRRRRRRTAPRTAGRGRDRSAAGCTSTRSAAPSPLFAPPRAEEAIERLATEPDLPLPLRPRRLLALLQAARRRRGRRRRAAARRAARSSDADAATRADPRLRPRAPRRRRRAAGDGRRDRAVVCAPTGATPGARSPPTARPVFVRYAYGAMADVGAGTYDRSDVHDARARQRPLDAARATGEARRRGRQVAVAATPARRVDQARRLGASRRARRPRHAHRLDRRQRPLRRRPRERRSRAATGSSSSPRPWPTRACPAASGRGPGAGRYVPDGLRPHVRGTLTVTGGPGSSVVLDGLMLEGDVVVDPGDLGSLTVAQCDRDRRGPRRGGRRAEANATPAGAARAQRRRRGRPGRHASRSSPSATRSSTAVTDRRRRARRRGRSGARTPRWRARRSAARVTVRTLDASSCVLDGTVDGRAPPGRLRALQLRRPGLAHAAAPPLRARRPRGDDARRPVYVSTDPASPAYLALAAACSPLIADGRRGRVRDGRPPPPSGGRCGMRAAERQLDPYLPVGSQLGLFGGGHAR